MNDSFTKTFSGTMGILLALIVACCVLPLILGAFGSLFGG